ncbi:dihydroxyacetone kinase family protein [uncultured Pseudokineococcus sp.]|uniref:dihydroxyacetone kinase family protein n=1 Tax=uncultured Pseudokineococcus sp. TaxID=1642928 RepID=UPI0026069DAC|nr:dihydroxyacetone kinase family protein [uncultured Pseudokineococcus sp.]
MTLLVNDPDHFADEAVDGLVAAHPQHLRRVRGGVVRARPGAEGSVALVVGGGSGHYPAFAGWVGEGFAAGAACGGMFSSPSASQIRAVVRAAEVGGGALLGYGKYAGDVLHFGLAAEMLRSEGVDVREIAITDDIASAGPDSVDERRGIAGDLVVLKVAGAAAAAGLDLDAVEALARRANDRTRTLGVALSGCTLPGAREPLFTIDRGRMGVGLGIHGEPGLEERDLPAADGVADLLADGVLAEEPERGDGPQGYRGRVAVVLNGLGGGSQDELLVLHRRVDERLREAGLVVVRPEVGELVTSLDMTGASLTIAFLDDELEEHWRAACDAPAYRRSAAPADVEPVPPVEDEEEAEVPPAAEPSQRAAHRVADAVDAARDVVVAASDRLGELDAVAGDGDHGIGMARGLRAASDAARRAVDAGAGCRTVLVRAGEAWSEGAGGTSGALWGAALTAAGSSLDDDRAPSEEDVVTAVRAGVDAVLRLGGARPGDKTMVDAIVPFVEALESRAGDQGLRAAWDTATRAAVEAAEATADVSASVGRARTHGDRSVGTPDPGALSFSMVVRAVVGDLSADEAPGAVGPAGRDAGRGPAETSS